VILIAGSEINSSGSTKDCWTHTRSHKQRKEENKKEEKSSIFESMLFPVMGLK
jgi:hypothetical protein